MKVVIKTLITIVISIVSLKASATPINPELCNEIDPDHSEELFNLPL